MSRVQRTSQSQRQPDGLSNEGMTHLGEEKEDDYATRPREAIGILTLRERLPIHNRRGIACRSRLSLSVDGDVAARAGCVSIHHSLTHDWGLPILRSAKTKKNRVRKEDFDGKEILTGRPGGDVVRPTLRSSPLLYRSREIFASQGSCEDPAIRGAREESRRPLATREIGAHDRSTIRRRRSYSRRISLLT